MPPPAIYVRGSTSTQTPPRGRKVTNMQWMGLVIIGIFGGATLLLRDETFIKWKPTVLYWIAGGSFLIC